MLQRYCLTHNHFILLPNTDLHCFYRRIGYCLFLVPYSMTASELPQFSCISWSQNDLSSPTSHEEATPRYADRALVLSRSGSSCGPRWRIDLYQMRHMLDSSSLLGAEASRSSHWQTIFGYCMCRKCASSCLSLGTRACRTQTAVHQAFDAQRGKGNNFWFPTSDGAGVAPGRPLFFSRVLALEWIQLTAVHLLPAFGLQLHGEVWYQGRESLDCGRFYAEATGCVAIQTIKLCPGVVGAVACNNVALLKTQPVEALKTKDGFGRTVAMLAALFNSWDVLQHLLTVSGGINWSESQSAQVGHVGKTSMHYLCSNPPTTAAAHQYAKIVSMLPDMLPAAVLEARDAQGFTALVLAVKSRNIAMVRWLLSHGANPNADSVHNTTTTPSIAPRPITVAVQLKDAQYLEQLLASGASVHFCDVLGNTPLSQALNLQHAEQLQLLVLYGANLDVGHIQFRHGATGLQTIRQIIKDFPAGTLGAALKTAMVQALAARRRLAVLTLGSRVVPALSQDIMQIICQYSCLMP